MVQPPLSVTTRVRKAAKPSKSGVVEPVAVATSVKGVATPATPSQEEDNDDSCLVHVMAQTMRLGQSYKSIGFDKECAIINKDLAARSE